MSTGRFPRRLKQVRAKRTWSRPDPPQVILGIATASATDEVSPMFGSLGVGNAADARTLWLHRTPKEGRKG